MELSSTAAYSNASIYTVQDVQDIVSYAGERGIDVLMVCPFSYFSYI